MTKIAAAVLFLVLNAYIYHFFASKEVIPARRSFDEFPLELGDWRCELPEEIEPKTLNNLGATDYLVCNFVRRSTNDTVSIYFGYHASQVRREGGGAKETSIHPPEHCLPGAGWSAIDTRIVDLDDLGLPGGDGPHREAKRFIIAKGSARQLTYFWYQSRGRVLARNHEVILYRFLDRAIRHRTDGSLVRITIPIGRGDIERAEAIFHELASAIVPLLPEYVPD